MEIDYPRSPGDSLSPRTRIIQRLATNGVPEEYLGDLPSGFVAFVKQTKSCILAMVSAILPTDAEVAEAIHQAKAGSKGAPVRSTLSDLYHESMVWLQWLMFEEEPLTALENLANMSVGQGGICGAVWGNNDVAFRCRTCEHDPTCAICVPCFQNGNHKDHDYSIIYTGGGCCDCGDETAWKPEGFCSKHRGAGMIQPLHDDVAQSVGPVLDALFDYWKSKLMVADSLSTENLGEAHNAAGKVENELTLSVVEMLLEFCRCSEGLLSFVSKKLISAVGLLDILIRAERFLKKSVTKKLHKLLLKLLGEPGFKYEFGKAIVNYYPVFVHEVVKERSDIVLRKYPLLSSLSVQILTVPTLTMRLVKEVNLLEVLLDCIGEILFCSSGEDGLLQINKWSNLFDTTIRILEDVKFVLRHPDVAEYITCEQQHIFRAWLRILSFVQGMNPQKRETDIHVEEENENVQRSFYLCHSIYTINSLLVSCASSVNGAKETAQDFSVSCKHTVEDDEHGQRHAKVGRISQESSASTCPAGGEWKTVLWDSETKPDSNNPFLVPSYISLAFECLRVIDRWVVMNNISNALALSSSGDSSGIIDVSSMIENSTTGSGCFQVLSLSAWQNIDYDVFSREITLHIPLHWLLSFILKEALRKHYSESLLPPVSSHKDPLVSDKLEFFGKVLRGCQPCGFSSFMMEHPLQIRAFCAQVRAGMWRKNGDAAIISYELYHSAQLSANALELDLFLLQICAAFAPADSYVRRILARFGLLNYISLDLQPYNEFEPVLVQEMLVLIIQIVKERQYCGFTASENLQRELVCKLATGDATRSQLQKSLPCDLSKVDLQVVLDNIAQYSNPSGMKQGRYSLRLSYWKELDLYHPHWSPRDLQIAEEKYLQFCGVSAMISQLPKWTRIYQPLNGISRIATCKTVFEIVRAVLFYSVCDKTAQSRAPDRVLITALHLLSLALDICSVYRESGQLFQDGELIPLLAFAGEEINTGPTTASDQHSLLSLLVSLLRSQKNTNLSFMEVGNFKLHSLVESLLKKFAELDSDCKSKFQQVAPDVYSHLFQPLESNAATIFGSSSDAEKHKAKARQRQAAILARMKAEQSKFLESIKAEESNGSKSRKDEQLHHAGEDTIDSTHQICSLCHDSSSETPVSLLILLQKSRLVSFVDKGPPSWDRDWQSDKGKVCATANAMAGSSGSDAEDSTNCVLPLSQCTQLARDAVNEFSCDACPAELNAFVDYLKEEVPELRSLSLPAIHSDRTDKIACSLEYLEQDMFSSIQKEMDNAAFESVSTSDDRVISPEEDLKRSTDINTILMGKYIASLKRECSETSSGSNNNDPHTVSTMTLPPYDGFGPIGCDGIHLSSCGHAVHQLCLDRYLSSLMESYNRRVLFEGGNIVDPDQGEFLCPVCRRLANSVLPEDPRDSEKFWNLPAAVDMSSSSSASFLVAPNQDATLSLSHALRLLKSAACAVSREEIYKAFAMPSGMLTPSVENMCKMLCRMYFPEKKDVFLRAGRVRTSLLMWDTLKYSLVSTEIAARSANGRTSTSSDNCLSTELNFSSGTILSLLLRLAVSTRSKSLPDILLRFRGILLFAASICCGFDESSKGLIRQDGKIQHVLNLLDGDLPFPDTQFWNRASDPVLSRDPFSTLMWILLCLPYPFMFQKESLISLVHMFYAVIVTQGIIAYCVNHEGRLDMGVSDSLVTDIVKLVAGSATAHQYFVSDYIDPCSNFMDSLRLLSLPFLRRCALLYKLLNYSNSVEQLGGNYSHGTSDVHGMDSGVFLGDLDEVSELENMFRIPSLDVVLEDKHLRFLVPKWICHFDENLKNCCIQRPLYLNPAVPFQLMRLPFVYQDLLQRCIKPRCPDCNSVLPKPALCLLCGRLCSWKPCCRESGCQSHAISCGAGTGVFLLIKNTAVLLQQKERRALWPSPYLDAFGEEDPEMHRGKPLYLNKERYSALNYMVASHGLDRCSKVLHQTRLGFFMV